jgi:hypothetical protein
MYDELPRRVPERRSRARLGPLTRLRAKETAAVASTQLARVVRRARAIGIIAWRTCVAFAKLARRELGPFLRSVAAAAVPALQRVGRHVIDLLPSERPDGMTLLAGVAALVLMVSVSASLLSSHGPWLTFLR